MDQRSPINSSAQPKYIIRDFENKLRMDNYSQSTVPCHPNRSRTIAPNLNHNHNPNGGGGGGWAPNTHPNASDNSLKMHFTWINVLLTVNLNFLHATFYYILRTLKAHQIVILYTKVSRNLI